jgi:HNH endonuclease
MRETTKRKLQVPPRSAPRGRGHSVSTPRKWTAREIAVVRAEYRYGNIERIARKLRRTYQSVKSAAERFGLRTRHRWTPEQNAIVIREFPARRTIEVAELVGGHSLAACLGHARKLGIVKDPDYKRRAWQECGRALAASPAAIAARIKKGNVPLNKGLRRPGWFAGRMRETQFKKGQTPLNYLPIGTIKPNADGYLRIKISAKSNGRGANDKAWEFVHRRVWEKAHGPIPKGHRIWWKDGNHANCALENLELLSDQEHMARTTIHNLPPALKQVIQLAVALKRKIRKRQEKANAAKQDVRLTGSFVRNSRRAVRQG